MQKRITFTEDDRSDHRLLELEATYADSADYVHVHESESRTSHYIRLDQVEFYEQHLLRRMALKALLPDVSDADVDQAWKYQAA